MAIPKRSWKPHGYSNAAGAKEGLEKKIAYWENKDFNYEYGVSLGQAINLAIESGVNIDDDNFDDVVLKIFERNLDLKNDERFRNTFQKFFDKRAAINTRALEKEEQRLEEAQPGIVDFGDGKPGHDVQDEELL